MIRIFVDSTCDLPESYLEHYDIKMIPLRVLLNGKEFIDKVTIRVEQVYEYMRKGIIPKTSLPNLAETYEAIYKQVGEGRDCIYLAFSDKMSGTYQAIKGIFEQINNQFPERKMAAIDTKGGSMAIGLMALQAARLASSGKSFEEIVQTVNELVGQVEHIFSIADLGWLVKGGRLSTLEGLVGNILNIKPVLQVRDGLIEQLCKVRGRKKALRTMVDVLEERIEKFPEQTIGIAHAGDLETAGEMESMIKERLGQAKTMTSIIGGVLGAHLGIAGVGVFFFRQRPALYLD